MCREQILHLCRVAKKKLAMEFNMNIIFSDNSNNILVVYLTICVCFSVFFVLVSLT